MAYKFLRFASSLVRKFFFKILYGVDLKEVGKNVTFINDGLIKVGKSVRIQNDAFLCSEKGGKLIIGRDVFIGKGAVIKCYAGEVVIEDCVSINAYTFISGAGGVRIGKNTRIAAHTSIISSNHIFESREMPIKDQGISAEGVDIGEDCWLGTGVRVLDGVQIARGSILAAGAVVTSRVPAYSIYGGVPARLIKFRNS